MFRQLVACAPEVRRFLWTVEFTLTPVLENAKVLKPLSSMTALPCLQGDVFCFAHNSIHMFFLDSGKSISCMATTSP